MNDFFKKLTVKDLVLAFFAVLTLVGPLVYDWYKGRASINVEVESKVSVISKTLPIDDLSIYLNEKKIDALSKQVIRIKNSGNSPLTREDVIKPIRLDFKKAQIIQAKLTQRSPPNLDAELDTKSQSEIVVNFDLLNPGDSLVLEVLLLGPDSVFTADARVKNINEITILDNSKEKEEKINRIGKYFFPSILLSLLLVLAFFSDEWNFRLRIPTAKKVLLGQHKLFDANSISELPNILHEDKGLSFKQVKEIYAISLQLSFPLSHDDRQKILSALTQSELFHNITILKDMAIEIFLFIIFGFIPTLGVIQLFLSKITF